MRVSKLITFSALLTFMVVATFGLYLTFATPGHHDAGCPLMPGVEVICNSSLLGHLEHWKSAFAATLVNFFTLLAVAAVVIAAVPFRLPDKKYERFRTRVCDPDRPPLFQELFSQGILHPKAP